MVKHLPCLPRGHQAHLLNNYPGKATAVQAQAVMQPAHPVQPPQLLRGRCQPHLQIELHHLYHLVGVVHLKVGVVLLQVYHQDHQLGLHLLYQEDKKECCCI